MSTNTVSLAVGGSFLTLMVGVLSLVSPETSVPVAATGDGIAAPPLALTFVADNTTMVPEPQQLENEAAVAERVPSTECPFTEGATWEVVLHASEQRVEEGVPVYTSVEHTLVDVGMRPGTYRVHLATYAPKGVDDRPSETWALHLLDQSGSIVAKSASSRPLKEDEEAVVEILEPYLTVPQEATSIRVTPSGSEGEHVRQIVPLCVGLEPIALEGGITIEAVRVLDADTTTDAPLDRETQIEGVIPYEGMELVGITTTSSTSLGEQAARAGTSQAKSGTLALLVFFLSILALLVSVHARPRGVPEPLGTY